MHKAYSNSLSLVGLGPFASNLILWHISSVLSCFWNVGYVAYFSNSKDSPEVFSSRAALCCWVRVWERRGSQDGRTASVQGARPVLALVVHRPTLTSHYLDICYSNTDYSFLQVGRNSPWKSSHEQKRSLLSSLDPVDSMSEVSRADGCSCNSAVSHLQIHILPRRECTVPGKPLQRKKIHLQAPYWKPMRVWIYRRLGNWRTYSVLYRATGRW